MSEDEKTPITKKKKKTIFKIIKIFFISLFSIIILAGVAGLGVALAMVKTAPALDMALITDFEQPSAIYDNQGVFMDKVVTEEDRTVVPLDKIPDTLKNAFISIEDERFYEHKGIDPKRILGVAFIDIKNKLAHKDELQGASTLTQQLIKNTLFTSDTTFIMKVTRKIQEMYMAVKLEKVMNKDEILEAYLNLIPLGGKAHGVEAAANQYFSKSVKDLSLLECAFIAGVTQSPSAYYASAYSYAAGKTDKNVTPRFVNRTIAVLDKMLENNKISKADRDKAVDELKNGKLVFKFSEKSTDKLNYEWFSLPVINSVKQDLMKKYNMTADEVVNELMTGGLKIYSTMDRNLQTSAQKIMNDPKILKIDKSATKNGIIQPESSAVIMDYHTGEVKCIIGGRGEQPPKSYNRAVYNGSSVYVKPVGSSIKPLTVYGPAIDTKKATAGTVMEDSPLSIELQKLYGNGGLYNPKNYSVNSYTGYETMRFALQHSHNLPAVKFADLVSVSTSRSYAEKVGIPGSEIVSIAASALGELPHGTNTMTMATAYGMFGNNGIYTPSRLYTKVVDKTGKTLLEGPTQDSSQVISPQTAYIMWDLLKGPTKAGGTAAGLSIGGMPIGGKTGTTSDNKNAWFCGLSPYLSGSVWIGYDKPITMSGISSSTAAHVWAAIMKEASKGQSIKDIALPSGLVKVSICKDSGKLPTDNCKNDPRGDRVYSEWFIAGTQPTSLCDVHVSVQINKDNNKLATAFTPLDKVIDKVFITRSYVPKVTLQDQKYVVPTASDDTPAPPAKIAVTGVDLNKNAKLKVGEFVNLTAVINPKNASNQNTAWTSSDETIATVDNTGKVTGIAQGNAIITVSTEDGGYTAACSVDVH